MNDMDEIDILEDANKLLDGVNQQLRAENARLKAENAQLRSVKTIIQPIMTADPASQRIVELETALMQIIDLARTGLKPDIYPDEDSWNRSKLRSIVNMASVALQEVRDE